MSTAAPPKRRRRKPAETPTTAPSVKLPAVRETRSEDLRAIGATIRLRRQEKDASLDELCAAAKLDRTTLWRLEYGTLRGSIRLETLSRLAYVLDLAIFWTPAEGWRAHPVAKTTIALT